MLSSGLCGSFCEFELTHVDYLSNALDHLRKRETDAVILDLGLPDSLGLDALASILQQQPAAPIIVLTGLSDESVGIEAVQKGAQDYLIKGQIESSLLKRSIYYAIERKKVEERLRFISLHDGLTRLYNRGYFEEELSRLKDDRHLPVSLIVCDVDGLKRANDEFGHAAGDRLIIQARQLISGAVRECDMVARIGGDEFAVILPKSDGVIAEDVCSRIVSQIELFNKHGKIPRLSLSMGFAVRESTGMSMQDLFETADNRMYLAKAVAAAKRESMPN